MNNVSAPSILADAFKAYKDNFAAIVMTSLAIILPAGIVYGLLVFLSSKVGTALALLLLLIAIVVLVVASMVLTGFLVFAVREWRKGNTIESKQLVEETKPFIGALIGNGILKTLAIIAVMYVIPAIGVLIGVPVLAVLGFLAGFVVAIILSIAWIATSGSIVDEGKSATSAFGRSAELTSGHKGTVFLALLLLWLVFVGVYIALGIVFFILQFLGIVGVVLMVIVTIALAVAVIPVSGMLEGTIFYELRDGPKS